MFGWNEISFGLERCFVPFKKKCCVQLNSLDNMTLMNENLYRHISFDSFHKLIN